jgi:hypothetical protein
MATRPIFVPNQIGTLGATEKPIEFKWHPGMAKSQKQKSITELHASAQLLGYDRLLEISSKSEVELGVKLSAFNLLITTKKNNNIFTVETAFQGSKVFARGGPYKDLFGLDSLAAKKDIRLKDSGSLKRFEFFGVTFPLEPRTFFYDWIYINALVQNEALADAVKYFDGFTDIEFNPKKSINCQAHSVALYVSLVKCNLLDEALLSPENFLKILISHYERQNRNIGVQDSLV